MWLRGCFSYDGDNFVFDEFAGRLAHEFFFVVELGIEIDESTPDFGIRRSIVTLNYYDIPPLGALGGLQTFEMRFLTRTCG